MGRLDGGLLTSEERVTGMGWPGLTRAGDGSAPMGTAGQVLDLAGSWTMDGW